MSQWCPELKSVELRLRISLRILFFSIFVLLFVLELIELQYRPLVQLTLILILEALIMFWYSSFLLSLVAGYTWILLKLIKFLIEGISRALISINRVSTRYSRCKVSVLSSSKVLARIRTTTILSRLLMPWMVVSLTMLGSSSNFQNGQRARIFLGSLIYCLRLLV